MIPTTELKLNFSNASSGTLSAPAPKRLAFDSPVRYQSAPTVTTSADTISGVREAVSFYGVLIQAVVIFRRFTRARRSPHRRHLRQPSLFRRRCRSCSSRAWSRLFRPLRRLLHPRRMSHQGITALKVVRSKLRVSRFVLGITIGHWLGTCVGLSRK